MEQLRDTIPQTFLGNSHVTMFAPARQEAVAGGIRLIIRVADNRQSVRGGTCIRILRLGRKPDRISSVMLRCIGFTTKYGK